MRDIHMNIYPEHGCPHCMGLSIAVRAAIMSILFIHTLCTSTRFLSLSRPFTQSNHAFTHSHFTALHSSWLTVEKTLMGIFFITTSRNARETSAPSPFLANSLGHSGRYLCTNFITIYIHTMSDGVGWHCGTSSRHRHSHTYI